MIYCFIARLVPKTKCCNILHKMTSVELNPMFHKYLDGRSSMHMVMLPSRLLFLKFYTNLHLIFDFETNMFSIISLI